MTELSVLIPSCDAYADVWRPFFALFHRHWSDCPYSVYLGSNHITCDEPNVASLLIGEDRSWACSTRRMVEQIQTPYILMILEDFLLQQRVDTCRIVRLIADLERLQGGYLRLKPFPPPDVRLARFPEIGEIEPGAPYRGALQAAIWRRDTLLSLLRDEETAWEMEIYGSRRTDMLDCGFYCVWKAALVYTAGVTLGRWTPQGVAICRQQGVTVDLARRPMMKPGEALRLRWRWATAALLGVIPWKLRESLLLAFRSTGLRRPKPLPGRETGSSITSPQQHESAKLAPDADISPPDYTQ